MRKFNCRHHRCNVLYKGLLTTKVIVKKPTDGIVLNVPLVFPIIGLLVAPVFVGIILVATLAYGYKLSITS